MIDKLNKLRESSSEEGFTLIELMVVVVIIAILAVIALIGGAVGTVISLIINSISGKSKSSKYYLMIFGMCALVTLIISGMVCGSM